MPDDAELLRRYAEEKSESAFTELLRRHIDAVYAAAIRQVAGDAHRAQDVTQVVFATLAQKARSLTRHPTLPGWLHRTTFHVAAKARRTEARRSSRERAVGTSAEWIGFTAPAIMGEESEAFAVDTALGELRAHDREIVVLRFLGQQTFAEIGQTLGLSEDAARRRVERALRRLRERLAGRGITSIEMALTTHLTRGGARLAPAGLAERAAQAALATGSHSLPGWLGALERATSWKIIAGLGIAVATILLFVDQGSFSRGTTALASANAAPLPTAPAATPEVRSALEQPTGQVTPSPAQAIREQTRPLSATAPIFEQSTVRPAVAAAEALMARHPEVRRAIVAWQVAKVHFQYGPLLDRLGLDPQQRDRFAALVRSAHFFGEWGPDGQFLEFHTPTESASSSLREQLAELLGPAGLGAYEAFRAAIPAREIAAQVAARLSLRGEAPTPAQTEALVGVFETSPWRRRNGGSDDEFAAGWREVEARSARVLSESQQSVIRDLAAQEQAYVELSAHQRALADAPAPEASEATTAADPGNAQTAFAALQARIEAITRQDPSLQSAKHAASRRSLDWQYAGVSQQLGLEATANRQLLDHRHRRAVEHEDMLAASRGLGLSDYDPAVQRWNADSEARYQAAQRALLGDAGARALQRFEATIYPRQIAHGFAGMAALAGLPVDAVQLQQLIDVMVATTREPPPGVFPARIDIDWPEVDRRAEQILTPAQARLFHTAEAPGLGRGGARFVVQLNQALLQANRLSATTGRTE